MIGRKRTIFGVLLPICRAFHPTVGPTIRAIMSDIDGTLVHYAKDFAHHGVKLISSDEEALTATVEGPSGERRRCRLLPSATMGPACISERTIELVEALRARGVLFCVCTAARKSTMMRRLDMLPTCDAVVCEGGSRMVVNGALDIDFTKSFETICGPMSREVVGEDDRPEPLWQYYRLLQEKVSGLSLDANSYFGMFRASALGDETTEDALQEMISKIPHGISVNSNLGKTDFFPTLAGKANAVMHLQKKFGIDILETVCLFDDDNDLLMAEQCGVHLLPSLTSFSIKNAVSRNPSWFVPKAVGQGVFATEECLEKLLSRVMTEQKMQADVDLLLGEVKDEMSQQASLDKKTDRGGEVESR